MRYSIVYPIPGTTKGTVVMSRGKIRCTGVRCRYSLEMRPGVPFESYEKAIHSHIETHRPDARDDRVKWVLEKINQSGGEAQFWPDEPVWPLLEEMKADGLVGGEFCDIDSNANAVSWIRIIDPPRAMYLLECYPVVKYNMADWMAAALVFPGHSVPFDARDMETPAWRVLRMLVSSGRDDGKRIAEGEFNANNMAIVHLTPKGEEYLHSKTFAAQLGRWSNIALKVLRFLRIASISVFIVAQIGY